VIKLESKGSFRNTEKFLKTISSRSIYSELDRYGKEGVFYLSESTPKDTTKTSESWTYEINYDTEGVQIYWSNDQVVDGVPIVILLQYGHSTGSGGFVQGNDFINPAIKPVFNQLAEKVWKAVRSA
jgi:hypothetical protein